MNKFIVPLVLLLSFAPRAVAGIDPDAVELHAGDKAPYTGVLLSPERANSVKVQLQERDLFEQIVTSQTKSISLLKQNNEYTENKVNILLTQNDKLAEQLHSAQGLNNWERLGLVVLGVALTVGAGYAVHSIAK